MKEGVKKDLIIEDDLIKQEKEIYNNNRNYIIQNNKGRETNDKNVKLSYKKLFESEIVLME